jgi:peroxiredoxin
MKRIQAIPTAGLYALFLVLGAAWVWMSKAPPGATTNGQIPAPQVGFLAPEFRLPSTTGEEIALSELRGQPVLVNIWATWCPPCRAEMPAMQEVYQEYQESGFTILAVNATHQDNAAEAIAFGESYGLSFPILFDRDGEVSRLYEVRALPTSFFIDDQGIIRELVVGGPMSEALLRIRVEELIEAGGGGR